MQKRGVEVSADRVETTVKPNLWQTDSSNSEMEGFYKITVRPAIM